MFISNRFNLSHCKYLDIDGTFSFYALVDEKATHLFCDCRITNTFCVDLSSLR